jgi:glutathione S-transferase
VLYFWEVFRRIAQQVFFTPPGDRDEQALVQARAELRTALLALEGRAAGRKGDFMMGASFTRADTTWIPFVEIAARGGVDLEPSVMPWLAAWRGRMRTRPAYERSFPPHWRK